MPRKPVEKAAPAAKPKKSVPPKAAAKSAPKPAERGIIQLPTELLKEAEELVPALRVALSDSVARDAGVRWTRSAVLRIAIREGLVVLREKYSKAGK
jgi:hypothetical protein